MKIHFIRHGKTFANEKKLYCGVTDIPLSEKGISELFKLKQKILYPTCDFLVTSSLLRTNQTAEILYGRNPDLLISDLNEFNFGIFEMKSYEELKENPLYINWIKNYESAKCADGDSKLIFTERIHSAFNRLLEMKAENIVIICHGGVIATIMELLFPNTKNFYEWQPTCGRGYTFDTVSHSVIEI